MDAHFLLASISAATEAPASAWDSPGILVLKLSAVLFLVLTNGFFVASEFAIVKVRASQLDALPDQRSRGVGPARKVVEHLDAYLSATQLGVTLASLALGWVGEPFVARMIEPFFALAHVGAPAVVHTVSFVLAFTFITVLHIVLGELAPKSLAIRKALPTTLLISRPLRLFHGVFRPAIWTLNALSNWTLKHVFRLEPATENEEVHSEDELRLLVKESARSDEISGVSQEIVTNAFDMRRLLVREVMTPRAEVVFLDARLPFQENLQRIKAAGHSRFPLCEGDFEHTIGLVHLRDVFALLEAAEPELTTIRKELLAVPESMPLEQLLPLCRRQQAHLAVVVDEYGANVGIVTLQHVIAEIIGEEPDEFGSERREFHRVSANEFRVEGGLGLYELRDLAGVTWQSADVSTVGGFITARFGHLPHQGEQVTVDEYLITIEQANGRRIEQLHFQKQAPELPPLSAGSENIAGTNPTKSPSLDQGTIR